MRNHDTKLRGILTSDNPDQKRVLDEARRLGANAAEKLALRQKEGEMVVLQMGKNGVIHVKGYGREW